MQTMQSPLRLGFWILTLVMLALAGCGGGGRGSSMAAITAQPADQSVVEGTTATFRVTASNAVSYQWQISTDSGVSFTDVAGATAAGYITPATTLADGGKKYRVVVSNSINSVISSAAALTVTAAPVAPAISVQPANRTVIENQNASFSITATGTTLAYQWQRSTDGGANFADLSGETNATLTRTSVLLTDNGQQFRVVVTNVVGSVTSNAATLTVNPTPVVPAFTTQPTDQSVTAPATASFSVIATGTPAPTLQWQLSTDGVTWNDIAGATAVDYTTPATVVADSGNQYRVIATNSAGTANSNAATLTVAPTPVAPSFSVHPTSRSVTEPATATFTVAAEGVPTPNLQWQLSTDNGMIWSNIGGATAADYTTPATMATDNGTQYRAVATNSVGTTNSNAAALTVTVTLDVNLAGTGTGTVTSSPAGIICGADCTEAYNQGTAVTLNATPAAGQSFTGWTGGGCSGTGTCVVTMTAATSVTATFSSCATGTQTFSYTGAMQTFTVPACVTSITIDASGAQGGTSTGQTGGQNFTGGLGARASGTFAVSGGEVIDVLVGGRGQNGSCGSGGGGGSFVVRSGVPLVIAAGGGGGFHCTVLGGLNGVGGNISTSGGSGACTTNPSYPRSPTPGGTNGNGAAAFYGGGGGGFLTAGTSQMLPSAGGGSYPGLGGTPGGGFGGGGGYYTLCCGGSGGGGGYSGGGGSQADGCAGGGGGSLNNGTLPSLSPAVRSGNGVVVISY